MNNDELVSLMRQVETLGGRVIYGDAHSVVAHRDYNPDYAERYKQHYKHSDYFVDVDIVYSDLYITWHVVSHLTLECPHGNEAVNCD